MQESLWCVWGSMSAREVVSGRLLRKQSAPLKRPTNEGILTETHEIFTEALHS